MYFPVKLAPVSLILVICKIHETISELKCGYKSCHKTEKDKLNIHLVPHSHDDLGWLKTVDQYYYDLRGGFHHSGVQYIIDSVVAGLLENPNRRFIQVETAFFWKWWKEQTTEKQDSVRMLVNAGRLEIIGGGWSMNDEAVANYQEIIDQFTLGLQIINDTLGECGRPKIGWQIDPFGHTREMASIFSQLGYDGVMFTRLDYRDVKKREEEKNMEFVWRGSPDLGKSSDIFISLVYKFYGFPDYFCWDVLCGDLPIVEDEDSPHFNVKLRVDQFIRYVKKQAAAYKTNNILITMGGDFTYQAAQMIFINTDKLIRGFHRYYNESYNVIYSTPSCYIYAVNQYATRENLTFSLKTGDFIPHASDPNSYWTGYYTSRPNSKRFEREANNLLQVMKQLTVFAKFKSHDFSSNLIKLKEIMGIMQHHDAITGTEKQHVADDYVRLITIGIREAEANVTEIIHNLLRKGNKNQNVKVRLVSCLLANVTSCEESNAKRFVVAVYNPLSRMVSHHVRLPVLGIRFSVRLLNGTSIKYQVAPSIDKFSNLNSIKTSSYELVFKASDLPPLGLRYYYIKKLDKAVGDPDLIKEKQNMYSLGNKKIGIKIDSETGLLQSVKFNGVIYPVIQNFLYYLSANGTNKRPQDRASGAYIFRPAVHKKTAIEISKNASIKVYKGILFDEVHQQFSDFTKQVIRVYKDENHVEFTWLVGPLEYQEELGIEVISRYTTKVDSGEVFYTDTNGRGLIKRIRSKRDTYNYTDEEPVSGNYYPITSRIVIRDSEKEFSVLTDRAQGGSSLNSGEVELMLHRRLMNDDDFGVNEVLDEIEFSSSVRVLGRHYLIFGKIVGESSTAAQQHDVAQRKLLSPWTFVGKADNQTQKRLMKILNTEFSEMNKPLPRNIQILTLEPWSRDSVLLRLEHVFEGHEDSAHSKSVVVNLRKLFKSFKISAIQEMTLGGNQKLKDNQKLTWKIKENLAIKNGSSTTPLSTILSPMEIRTFIIRFQNKHDSSIGQKSNTISIFTGKLSFKSAFTIIFLYFFKYLFV